MPENLFEAQYDISKKSKLKRFYDTNKVLIISSVLIVSPLGVCLPITPTQLGYI